MKQSIGHLLAHGALTTLISLAGTFALPVTAVAGPASSIYSPIVDYHEWELELKGGLEDWNDADGERAVKLAVGYAPAPRWKVEVEAEYVQVPGHAARVEEYELESVFQLTEHGKYWFDAGLFAELEHNRLDNENTLKLGPMLQKETAHTQTNVNVYWERRLDSVPGGASRDELEYQVQWKYALGSHFEPGVQVFGSLGDPSHLRSEEIKVGPAFFGTLRLGNGKSLHYDAAILAGLTDGTPDTTIRFQLEYEFF